MPTGIAATRTAPHRERRSRTAVGATAGRSHRAGTNRSAGHRRRAQTTMRPASRLSIAALSPLCIARGYVRAASAANAADRHPPRSFPRATSLLLRAKTSSAGALADVARLPWFPSLAASVPIPGASSRLDALPYVGEDRGSWLDDLPAHDAVCRRASRVPWRLVDRRRVYLRGSARTLDRATRSSPVTAAPRQTRWPRSRVLTVALDDR
jgi:hypothetical protein